eukprot:1152486-Pelagomonas_calceolata.AAC.3
MQALLTRQNNFSVFFSFHSVTVLVLSNQQSAIPSCQCCFQAARSSRRAWRKTWVLTLLPRRKERKVYAGHRPRALRSLGLQVGYTPFSCLACQQDLPRSLYKYLRAPLWLGCAVYPAEVLEVWWEKFTA